MKKLLYIVIPIAALMLVAAILMQDAKLFVAGMCFLAAEKLLDMIVINKKKEGLYINNGYKMITKKKKRDC